MNYYFDESGNWAEPGREQKKLVIGGILLKNNHIIIQLEQEMKLLKANIGLKTFHAADVTKEQLEQSYRLIYNFLNPNNISVFIRYYKPTILHKKTIESVDDVYIDLASSLVDDIAFGDPNINIEFDMKFHYAYPKNVISKIEKYQYGYYMRMMKNFKMKNKTFLKEQIRISDAIERITGFENDLLLYSFYQKINQTSQQKELSRKFIISDYLWSEFLLKIEGQELMRERFKDKIQSKIKNKLIQYDLKDSEPKISLKFSNKHKQSVGVQIIDILCHLVYRNGKMLKNNASSTVNGIYSKIQIEEVK